MQETWVPSLGRKDPMEKEMAIHFSTLAWETPWTEEPGGLQSTGSEKGHDSVTKQQKQLILLCLLWGVIQSEATE